jgi:hypothetical protein
VTTVEQAQRPATALATPARVCAAVSGVAGLLAAFASQDGTFRTSALVKVAADDPIAQLARSHDRSFALVTSVEHYDGVYYYATALDPFARGTAHTLIDQAAYRYGHPLHGWLAALLSFGRPGAVPAALFLLSLIGLCVAGWAASRLAEAIGGSPWLGLAVALSPGLLYATTVDTTETVGAALILCALLAWHRQRWNCAVLLVLLCCLDREQYVSVPLGLAAWEVVTAVRSRRRPPGMGRKLLAVSLGPVALVLWHIYVHATLHAWPFSAQQGNVGAPLKGALKTVRDGAGLSRAGNFYASQIGAIVGPLLVMYLVLFAVASVVAVRMRSCVHGTVLAMVGITLCQGWRTLLYPHEIFRTPAVVTLLAVLTVAAGARQRGGPSGADADSSTSTGSPTEITASDVSGTRFIANHVAPSHRR